MLKDDQEVYSAFKVLEQRRNQVITDLKKQLDLPFNKPHHKKKMSMTQRNDPIRKIIKTNKKVHHSNYLMNNKLLMILTRSDFDRPIMMHDKLDYIWDKGEGSEFNNVD